jgi:hypothetical protein
MTKEKSLSKAQKEALRFLLKGGYSIQKADITLGILCERGLVSITRPQIYGYWVTLTDYGRETAQSL